MDFASDYLAAPDHFPIDQKAEPWGSCSLAIELAGGPYCVNGLSRGQVRAIRQRFGDLFVSEHVAPGVRLNVFRAEQQSFKHVDFAGGDYTFDLDYKRDGVRFAGQNFMGRFQRPGELQADLWVPTENDLISTNIFENVFRTLVAYRLLDTGGMLFHSGAVVWQGKARLFFGRSGAGKSTISRMGLDAGHEVLSDDMNALVAHGDGYLVEKLPFAGDLGQTATAKGQYPVHGIYRLEQSNENRLEPMSPGAAVAALTSCAPFVNTDPHRYEQLSQNLERLCCQVPVKKLHFTTDGGFWDLLE